MESSTRPWLWHVVRLAVGVVLLAPIAVLGIGRLFEEDGHGGSPAARSRAEALPGVSAAPPTSTPTPSPSPAGCPESGLMVSAGGGEAAMGLRVQQLQVVNCGTVPRTLRGHPVVRVLDEDRAPLDISVRSGSAGITAVPSFDAAPATVTIKPGGRAGSAILWRNTYTDVSAPPAVGHYLEVTVAPGTAPQVITPEGDIDLGSTGKLGVAPWAARSGG